MLVKWFQAFLSISEPEVTDVLWAKYPEDQVSPRPGIPFYHKGLKMLCIRCKVCNQSPGQVEWCNLSKFTGVSCSEWISLREVLCSSHSLPYSTVVCQVWCIDLGALLLDVGAGWLGWIQQGSPEEAHDCSRFLQWIHHQGWKQRRCPCQQDKWPGQVHI